MHHALDVPRGAIAHWAFCKLSPGSSFACRMVLSEISLLCFLIFHPIQETTRLS
jgi:hypothetical protein